MAFFSSSGLSSSTTLKVYLIGSPTYINLTKSSNLKR
jgi:hypothetical protein